MPNFAIRGPYILSLKKKLQQCSNMENNFLMIFKMRQILYHEDNITYFQKKKKCNNVRIQKIIFLWSSKYARFCIMSTVQINLKKKLVTMFKYGEQFSYELQNMLNFARWGPYKLSSKKISTAFKYGEWFSYYQHNAPNFASWAQYKLFIFKKSCNNIRI